MDETRDRWYLVPIIEEWESQRPCKLMGRQGLLDELHLASFGCNIYYLDGH